MSLIDSYRDLILRLLPKGRAWTRDSDTVTYAFTEALATELSRVDTRARNLAFKELDPRTTSELLPDFEIEYGIPDPCGGLSTNPAKRLNNLITRITSLGGQSFGYFSQTLYDNGSPITITMQSPLTAGGLAGSQVKGNQYRHTWFVNIPLAEVIYFRAGLSRAGDPLTTTADTSNAVCFIERLKPGHTIVVYTFI